MNINFLKIESDLKIKNEASNISESNDISNCNNISITNNNINADLTHLQSKSLKNVFKLIGKISIYLFFIFTNGFTISALYPGCALTLNYL